MIARKSAARARSSLASAAGGSAIRGRRRAMTASDDAEPLVDREWGFDDLNRLEMDVTGAQFVEHSGAAIEQDRDEVDRDLVDETRGDVLPADGSPAHDRHVAVAGGGLRLLERALDAVGDEP